MTRYVIIGDGAAGTTAARTIRLNDPAGVIEIYSDDPNPAYFRASLTNYLIGELREDQIWAVPPTFYSEFRIKRLLARVFSVDFARGEVFLDRSRQAVTFDQLLIATGSRARGPAFENGNLPGVMTMRTLQDVRLVMDKIRLQGLRQAVIIGGGPLAIEWAQGLHERGVNATILLRGTRFMPGALDGVGSDLVLARLRQGGVQVLVQEEAETALPDRNGAVSALRTKSGKSLPCELVGVAIGVIPNSEFLKDSPLKIDKRGAIQVDDRMSTGVPNVYAGGDIAAVDGRLLQLWEPARWHGRTAAQNMTGQEAHYRPGTPYIATRLFDLDFASVGVVEPADGEEEVVRFPTGTGSIDYRKVVLKDGVLVGAVLLGERREGVRRLGRAFKKAIDAGVNVEAIKNRLLNPRFDLENWMSDTIDEDKPAAPGDMRTMANLRRSLLIRLPVPGMLGESQEHRAEQVLPEARLQDLQQGRVFPVGRVLRIGRAADNDIVPDDGLVSRYHAEVRWQGDRFYLHDLNSSNGTFLNDQRVTGTIPLGDGAMLRVGEARLLFYLERVEPARPAPAPAQAAHPAPARPTPAPASEPPAAPARPTPAPASEPPAAPARPAPAAASELPAAPARPTPAPASEPPAAPARPTPAAASEPPPAPARPTPAAASEPPPAPARPTPAAVPEPAPAQVDEPPHLMTIGMSTGTWAIPEPLASQPAAAFLEGAGQRWPLTDVTSVIGRDPASAIHIADPTVSHAHAQISLNEGSYFLQDLGSRNGTWVNDQQVSTPHPLADGDHLRLGKTELTFQLLVPLPPAAQPVGPPAPQFDQTAMGCPHCGEPIAVDTSICPYCGTQLREEPREVSLTAHLVIREGPGEGTGLPLGERTVIGRDSANCQLAIQHDTISRQHAEVVLEGRQYRLRDLGSRNGTFLNGEALPEAGQLLSDGDEISVGKRVRLVFQLLPEDDPDQNRTRLDAREN